MSCHIDHDVYTRSNTGLMRTCASQVYFILYLPLLHLLISLNLHSCMPWPLWWNQTCIPSRHVRTDAAIKSISDVWVDKWRDHWKPLNFDICRSVNENVILWIWPAGLAAASFRCQIVKCWILQGNRWQVVNHWCLCTKKSITTGFPVSLSSLLLVFISLLVDLGVSPKHNEVQYYSSKQWMKSRKGWNNDHLDIKKK